MSITKKKLKRCRRLLLNSLFVLSVIISAKPAISTESASMQVDLLSKPLNEALGEIGNIFGVAVIAPDNLIKGKVAPAMSNHLTIEEALALILRGTDLTYRKTSKGGFIVEQFTIESNQKPTAIMNNPDTLSDIERISVLGYRETGYVDRVQSGGTFGTRNVLDIPFSVTTISQQVLLDQQIRSLADLSRNDPSAFASSFPGDTEEINVRGYRLDNSSSYRREGLIFQNQVQTLIENKAAVEIIKGPTAIRYGFTPPGGVVNYILKRPTEETYRFLQLFGDTNTTVGGHLDIGGRLNDELGARVNALVSHDASFVDDSDGPRQMVSALFEWQATEKLLIDLEFEYQFRELEPRAQLNQFSFDATLTQSEKESLIDTFEPSTFLGQDWASIPQRSTIISIGAQYQISEDWQATGRIMKMNSTFDQFIPTIQNGSLQANGEFIQDVFFSPNQVRDPLSLEGYLNGTFESFGMTHEIAIGGSYSRNPLRFTLTGNCCPIVGESNIFAPVDLQQPTDLSAGPTEDALFFNQYAFFITDFISVTDDLQILAAIRYSRQKNEDVFNPEGTLQTSYDDGIYTPNFGLIYNPTDNISLYASISQGVTTGAQARFPAENEGQILTPAESEQYEIGVKGDFNGYIATAAYFDIDQPLANIDPTDNIFKYLGRQVHRGVEITLSGEIADGLQIISGALYLDPTIENPINAAVDGNIPAGVAEFQANLFLDYDVSTISGLAINGGVFFTDQRFADNENTFRIDSYVRFDLGARYEFNFGQQKLTARINLRNITDETFIEGVAFGNFLYGAPRSAFISLSTEF